MQSGLLGIHTWYKLRGSDDGWRQNIYLHEILCVVLSSYYWRKLNGPIKLYCDKYIYKLLRQNDLLWNWDEIDTDFLENITQEIDRDIYWAYPKLAIKFAQTERFASLDTDLFVTKNVSDFEEDIVYGHREKWLSPNLHREPLFDVLRELESDYQHDPINISLVVFNNLKITEIYREMVNNFCKIPRDKLIDYQSTIDTNLYPNWVQNGLYYNYGVYSDQKILGNIVSDGGFSEYNLTGQSFDVSKCNTKPSCLYDWYYDELAESGIFHTWGKKYIFQHFDPASRITHTNNLIQKIKESDELYGKVSHLIEDFQERLESIWSDDWNVYAQNVHENPPDKIDLETKKKQNENNKDKSKRY
jgi:hypothetical protein